MIGILICKKTTFDYKKLEAFLDTHHLPHRLIAAESLTENSMSGVSLPENSLSDVSLLLNAMGPYYVEEKQEILVNFFASGKNIIHLSAAPFTQSLAGPANNRELRQFEVVDDFTPLPENSVFVQVPGKEFYPAVLTHIQSATYHLCKNTENGTVRTGYLEHILDAYDADKRFIAAPVIRVVTFEKGSMTYFNFDFSAAMLDDIFWADLFLDVVKKELAGNLRLTVDCSLARYNPDEAKEVSVRVEPLFCTKAAGPAKPIYTLTLIVYDEDGGVVWKQEKEFSFGNVLPTHKTLDTHEALETHETSEAHETSESRSPAPAFHVKYPLSLSASGLYRVETAVTLWDTILAGNTTGFLVLSDEEIASEMAGFKPMYIDPEISTDYCLVDGEITAILGTTHFVTDVYRECFYYMNAWLCNEEIAALSKDGFNVLRSGNWVYIPEFYENDGSIGTRGLRALETYFILAARHGFTVQFALGTVLLNQWDKTRSPIHNQDMRNMCMNLIRSFAENFKSYPNVSLDIVNEPSYSIKGAWSTGRPSEEPEELARYKEWLMEKYGNPKTLRQAWGDTAMTLKTLDDISMPTQDLFYKGLCRTEQRKNHCSLADFYAFARNEFLGWTREIRSIVREIAPNMVVSMGRDETLRIPAEQDEVLAGNIDMVCWHQWNYNSNIIYEYLMNRVRGKVCVAQELGMYRFDDVRSGKRHSDEENADSLDKKLLYAMGNFVQWQAHDDPFMFELSENSLGIYRADKSPTPSVERTKKLVAAERAMQSYMKNKEDGVSILSVYNTSYYFSVENAFAHQGIKSHIHVLYDRLKEQADFLPEHLFDRKNASAIGNPKLIILPAMQTLSKKAWTELLSYVKAGATLFVSGCIDKEEHFAEDAKIGELDKTYRNRKLHNFEKLVLDGKRYALDFRPLCGHADVSNLFSCGEYNCGKINSETFNCDNSANEIAHAQEENVTGDSIREYVVGAGKILYCPYPVELSTNEEAVMACYHYAIDRAGATNTIYKMESDNPQIVFTAFSYKACTVYTLINEGFSDTISFTDLKSKTTFHVTLKDNQGAKLWVDAEGNLMQVYGDVKVESSRM